MSNRLTVFHVTTEDVWYEILRTGWLLPRSNISDFSKHEWMKMSFLASHYDCKGVFGIVETEMFKWQENEDVWRYLVESWIQFHGEEKPRLQLKRPVRLEFKVEIDENVFMFEENYLFNLARKYWTTECFVEKFLLMQRWNKYANGFVDSKIPVSEYEYGYQLPSIFIPHGIPVDTIYHKVFEIGEKII